MGFGSSHIVFQLIPAGTTSVNIPRAKAARITVCIWPTIHLLGFEVNGVTWCGNAALSPSALQLSTPQPGPLRPEPILALPTAIVQVRKRRAAFRASQFLAGSRLPENTLAMATGITDHVWSVRELLEEA